MARIAGVDLPRQKRVNIGLTYIYGIGNPRSARILDQANVDPMKKVQDLSEDEVNRIRQVIEGEGMSSTSIRIPCGRGWFWKQRNIHIRPQLRYRGLKPRPLLDFNAALKGRSSTRNPEHPCIAGL